MRPERAKAFIHNAYLLMLVSLRFCPCRAHLRRSTYPGRCPGLCARCPFGACLERSIILEIPLALLSLSTFPLSSFLFPLSTLHFLLSTFPLSTFPLSTFPLSTFQLSTLNFPLSTFHFPLSSTPSIPCVSSLLSYLPFLSACPSIPKEQRTVWLFMAMSRTVSPTNR